MLFLIPVRVTAHYEGSFEMYIKYGFLKIKLFPQKEKKNKKEKPKKDKAENTEQAENTENKKPKDKKKKENSENIFLSFTEHKALTLHCS